MQHLQIIEPGWENYTGPLGPVEFVMGVSVDPVPQRFADRVASVVKIATLDEFGQQDGIAGEATRLINSYSVVPPEETTIPVTAAEDELERMRDAREAGRPKVERFYEAHELEAIADKEGIKGLRKIGAPWSVRGRAIPELIEAILEAQALYNDKLTRQNEAIAAIETQAAPAPEVAVEADTYVAEPVANEPSLMATFAEFQEQEEIPATEAKF
jgi:hypothetical protein